MIWRENFQVIRIIRKLCDRTVIKNSFSFTKNSVKALIIHHCGWSVEYNTFFTRRISLSHIPPWCDPAGVLKVHFIPSDRKVLWIVPWSKLFKTFLSSLCAPIKLVLLTDLKCSTWPRGHIKRRIQFMQEFVSREYATSRCIARLVIQVNITPYLLTTLRPLFTSIGQK